MCVQTCSPEQHFMLGNDAMVATQATQQVCRNKSIATEKKKYSATDVVKTSSGIQWRPSTAHDTATLQQPTHTLLQINYTLVSSMQAITRRNMTHNISYAYVWSFPRKSE